MNTEHDMILSNLDLALQEARRPRLHLEYDERLSIANLALVEAARTWPQSNAKKRGVRFAAYARTEMRWAIADADGDTGGAGRSMRHRMQAVAKKAGELSHRFDRPPTTEEIAEALGWSVRLVMTVQRVATAHRQMSLDAPLPIDEGGGSTLRDILPDESTDTAAMVLADMQTEQEREKLVEAIDSLPAALRTALSLRSGVRVPACDSVTVDDVLRVSTAQDTYTSQAIRRLRKDGATDAIRPGTMVQSHGKGPEIFGESPTSPKATSRRHSAADFWNWFASADGIGPVDAAVNE